MKYRLIYLYRYALLAAALLPAGAAAQDCQTYAGQNNYQAAYAPCLSEAEAGGAEAQAMLAAMYITGAGVKKDPAQAAVWAEKAARQGNAQAQLLLGALYLQGEGVEQDTEKALRWLEESARQSAEAEALLNTLQ